MPLTTLDPKTALIVIDLQKGIVAMPCAHPMADVIAKASKLADGFRSHALPVVLVNVDAAQPGRTERPPRVREIPPEFSALVPEMNQHPSDHLVTKKSWGAFRKTNLEDYLRGLGVTQVVIAGVATTAGVESTARQAYEAGFHVTLATDAMTDMSLDAHNNSLANIFPRIGETGTTDEILSMLDNTRS